MRILFLSHYFPPEVNAPASRTYEMCKRWVRRGHQVTVVTCAPNAPDGVLFPGYRNRWVQQETMDGIQVIRVWTFLAANKGTFLRMANYVSYLLTAAPRAMMQPRHDILVATTPQLFCGWAGMIAAGIRRTPLVLEVRDMWAESITTLTAVRKGRFAGWLEWLEFGLYRRARTIVTVGEGYKRQLTARQVRAERIEIITNGVDREFFAPRERDEQLARQWGVEGRFVCTYAGTIGMAHSLDVCLRAARILKQQGRRDIVFLLVGDGALREELEREARAQQLDNVIFTGRQPKSMMPRVHSISDCSLVHLRKAPLFTTVLPSKIFEVAHMKRPIILGVEGDAARVVRESGGGICVEPENEYQLLDAVERLANNPALRRELGEAGHAYVAQHYDRDQLAQDYLDLLQRVAGKEPRQNNLPV